MVSQQSHYWTGLPYLILAGVGFVGLVIASLLPETLGEDLPQTIEDAETFLLDQPFFSLKKKGKSKKNGKGQEKQML